MGQLVDAGSLALLQPEADGAHLPVDDRHQFGTGVREHDIGAVVVAVHDPGRPVRGPVLLQPPRDAVDVADVGARIVLQRAIPLQLGKPARYLAFQETVGLAVVGQADGHVIDLSLIHISEPTRPY